MLQAVNGSGRVRVADNFGLGFPAETPPTAAVPLADTQLTFPPRKVEPFRRLERENLVRVMNLFVAEVLANGRFDPALVPIDDMHFAVVNR